MLATYEIYNSDLPQFDKLVANANKKAAKLGVPEYRVTVGTPFKREFVERGIVRIATMVKVTIEGETPKFGGWKLVGVVSPLKADSGEILSLVTTVPGEHVAGAAQTRDPLWCDHCKVRRDRLESFIVAHDDGSERQVGRNCLTDFLGDIRMSPGGLAALMNTISSISNSVGEWHKGPRQFDSESMNLVLACSIAAIRNFGWVTTKESRATDGAKTATKTHVSEIIEAFVRAPDCTNLTPDEALEAVGIWTYNFQSKYINSLPTGNDFAKAVAYRNNLSVLLDEETESSEYMDAIRLLNYAGAVNRKAMGIAVSIIALVDRKMGVSTDPIKGLLMAAQKNGKHVGQPKKREVFSGLTFIENFRAGDYVIATFVDANGNVIKTFGHQSLVAGTKVDLKATVVRHDTYKGSNSTIVNRVVVLN